MKFEFLRVVQAEVGLRKHRFQTQSGITMPIADFLRIPLELILRSLGRSQDGPWMCRGAVREIDSYLKKYDGNARVLELGGGASTAWLLHRSKYVHTVEPNPFFANSIIQTCQGFTNLNLIVAEIGLDLISNLDSEFDLIIIDFNETQHMSRELALKALRIRFPNATICLDNSDRYSLEGIDIRGCLVQVFVGLIRKPFCANQTTFFYPNQI